MKQQTILIVEDEQSLVETLQLKLEREGFLIVTAANGEQAIEQVNAVKPDLILLDLLLPKITGEEVLRAIKQNAQLKDIPIIIISNSGQPVEIKRLLEDGADDYIIKANFTIDDILERVHNTIDKQSGRADVLIAEDESFLRTVLAKKLRLEGLKVLTTLDGDTTLKIIREVNPRLVLLDLLMPGLSGIEILEHLNTDKAFAGSHVKIVVLSNYSGKENDPIIKTMTSGYWIKSNLDINEIVDKVKEMLG